MLDWGALVTGKNEAKTPENGEILGHCPKCAPTFSGDLGHTKPSNGAAFGGSAPKSPKSPSKKQGGERKPTETDAAGAAVPSNLCAQFTLNPIAVCLLFAWLEKVGGDVEELAGALTGLRSMTPDEQAKGWAHSCQDVGLDPWRVVHQQSYGEGQECTECKQLV